MGLLSVDVARIVRAQAVWWTWGAASNRLQW